MVRIIFGLAIFAHGISHAVFLANAWGYWRTDDGVGWFFNQVFQATSTTEGMFGLLWLVPLAGFVSGAWGYINGSRDWQPALLASSAVSTILIIIWWGGINMINALLALIVNLIVIGAVLWLGGRKPLVS